MVAEIHISLLTGDRIIVYDDGVRFHLTQSEREGIYSVNLAKAVRENKLGRELTPDTLERMINFLKGDEKC